MKTSKLAMRIEINFAKTAKYTFGALAAACLFGALANPVLLLFAGAFYVVSCSAGATLKS